MECVLFFCILFISHILNIFIIKCCLYLIKMRNIDDLGDRYTFSNISLQHYIPVILSNSSLRTLRTSLTGKTLESLTKRSDKIPPSRFGNQKFYYVCHGIAASRHRAIAGVAQAYFTEEKSRYSLPCHWCKIARETRKWHSLAMHSFRTARLSGSRGEP